MYEAIRSHGKLNKIYSLMVLCSWETYLLNKIFWLGIFMRLKSVGLSKKKKKKDLTFPREVGNGVHFDFFEDKWL